MEKNTGKKFITQGKLREFYLCSNVATLCYVSRVFLLNTNTNVHHSREVQRRYRHTDGGHLILHATIIVSTHDPT